MNGRLSDGVSEDVSVKKLAISVLVSAFVMNITSSRKKFAGAGKRLVLEPKNEFVRVTLCIVFCKACFPMKLPFMYVLNRFPSFVAHN